MPAAAARATIGTGAAPFDGRRRTEIAHGGTNGHAASFLPRWSVLEMFSIGRTCAVHGVESFDEAGRVVPRRALSLSMAGGVFMFAADPTRAMSGET